MRTERQHFIDRAVVRALLQVGKYLMPETTLRAQLELTAPVVPPPTMSEVDSTLRHLEAEGRVVAIVGEAQRKFRVTDAGRAWAAEEGIG